MQQQQQISSLLLNLGNSPMDRNALIQACEEIDHNLCAQNANTEHYGASSNYIAAHRWVGGHHQEDF